MDIGPGIEVQVSGPFRSIGGDPLRATFNANERVSGGELDAGRPRAGGAANMTIALLDPDRLFGPPERIGSSVGEVLRAGRSRAMMSMDLYNALNIDTVVDVNENFAAW